MKPELIVPPPRSLREEVAVSLMVIVTAAVVVGVVIFMLWIVHTVFSMPQVRSEAAHQLAPYVERAASDLRVVERRVTRRFARARK